MVDQTAERSIILLRLGCCRRLLALVADLGCCRQFTPLDVVDTVAVRMDATNASVVVARSVISYPVAVMHWMRVDCLLIVVDWMCLPEMYIVVNVMRTGCVHTHSCWYAIASLFKVLIRLLGMLTDAPLVSN